MDYGVEFRLNAQAVSARLSNSQRILALDGTDDRQNRSVLEFNKMVLAAGPWTPNVFTMLFPHSPIKIESSTSAGEWIVFKNPEPFSNGTIAAVFLDEIVGQKLEFAGRNDNTVWATGEKSQTGELPKVGVIPNPNISNLLRLNEQADEFLKHPSKEDSELCVLNRGRSYRPTTRTQLPIIAGVPACKLSSDKCDDGEITVYINFGHGSRGVTLGMGSGKLMSQIVLNESVDLDISKLDLPTT